MSIQPFICLGAETINDVSLNSVSLLAELLWRKIYQGCDSHWRFSGDHDVIRGTLLSKRPSIRTEQVVLALDELKRANLIHSRSTGRERWIEIAEPYRHRPKRYSDPRFGFSIYRDGENAQTELALGPVSLSPPAVTSRTDKKENKKTSTRAKFGEEEELLTQIRSIVGEEEINQNGGMWRMRIRHCVKAARYAIEDWKLRTPASPPIKVSRGAWLTDKYQRALVSVRSSATAPN